MKQRTKITAIIIAMVLMITYIFHVGSGMTVQAAKKAIKVGDGMYTVISEKNKTARFDRIASKTKTTLVIPATVKIGKKSYKVIAIKANALKGNKKIKKLTIGKNVKSIKAKAFYGCSNLKKITIKSTKITVVGKKAFGKLNSQVVVSLPKMSKNKVETYKRMLKKGGLIGKNQIIETNEPASETVSKKPTVIPNPEVRFAIGELKSGVKDSWMNTSTDASYGTGDSMRFTMWAKMPQEMYGSWSTKKKNVDKYERCNPCKKYFDYDTNNLAIHQGQTGHGGSSFITDPKLPNIEMWYWTPDNTPCKVVYHATIPDGLLVNKDNIEVWRSANEQINQDEGGYDIQVSGRDLTVTINDIKQGVYRNNSKSVIFATVVKFSARLDESAASINQVNANITYNYGKGDKVISMNPVTVRKK